MSKLQEEVRILMLQEEKELPEANPRWMQMKIELFSNVDVFAGLAKCAGYVKKKEEVIPSGNFFRGKFKATKKSKKRK